MELYTYFRSSASYRVRIALNLKNLSVESVPIDLRQGQHMSGPYREENPQGLVPLFKDDTRDLCLGQSLVILDYLEHAYPMPALLPSEDHLHWKARELATYIACDIHPLNNLRVLKYLQGTLNVNDEQKTAWYFHWLKEGFDVLERRLGTFSTPFALSNAPTWVDLCLIPQMYNAHRFNFDLAPYPRLLAIENHCLSHDAFQKAAPEAQSDCDV